MATLLFIAKPETRFWGLVVICIIVGLGYLANKLTKGKSIEYLKYQMNDRLKKGLFIFHGLGSLILALMLPNNYLNEIDSIRQLYDSNDLWIAASILLLLFLFLMMFGLMFTLIVALLGLKKMEE